MNWPDDADGDVMRRLVAVGFDFSKPRWIDFNIDFAHWPPASTALTVLGRRYSQAQAFDPENGSRGYILVRLFEKVSYDLVAHTQVELSESMAPFGGVCESWGVFDE